MKTRLAPSCPSWHDRVQNQIALQEIYGSRRTLSNITDLEISGSKSGTAAEQHETHRQQSGQSRAGHGRAAIPISLLMEDDVREGSGGTQEGSQARLDCSKETNEAAIPGRCVCWTYNVLRG